MQFDCKARGYLIQPMNTPALLEGRAFLLLQTLTTGKAECLNKSVHGDKLK